MLIGASRHEIWLVFLLEYREDEEGKANFCRKEASLPLLKTTASFINGAEDLMMSNNIIIVFL